MPSEDTLARTREAPASLEKRAAALEMVLRRKADMPENFVGEFTEHADDAWITANGARMVARAWTDPEYRTRMLADGTAAARELGFDFPEHRQGRFRVEFGPRLGGSRLIVQKNRYIPVPIFVKHSAPGEIRTHDLCLRRARPQQNLVLSLACPTTETVQEIPGKLLILLASPRGSDPGG